VWIDRGTAQSRQTATFGFAMAFRLNVLLMAMSTDLASVGYVLCAWLRTHQPDLLRPGQDAWSFDLDPLDNGTYDALIQLDLTQSISVAPDAQGTPRLTYLPEPEPLFADALPFAGLPEAPLLKAIAVVGEGQIAPSIPPMPDDDLTRLDEWLGQILQGLSAPERRSAALKLGQALRRSNLKRIAANVDPDGTPSPRANPATTARAACARGRAARCSRACAMPSTGASTPTKPASNSPRLPDHRPHGRRQPVRRNRHRRPPAQRPTHPRPLPRTPPPGLLPRRRRPRPRHHRRDDRAGMRLGAG
jgi:hypothetical protein